MPTLGYVSPFFIAADLARSVAFYRDSLGFQVDVLVPPDDPFFGIVVRDAVRIALKEITPEVQPQPNWSRHEWARWDAFIYTEDPDVLATEFQERGVGFREELQDHEDGMRGFAVYDLDKYALFFGRPV